MQLQMIAAQDAKVILCKYLDKFVKVKEKQLQDAKRVANLEVQLKEKAQALDEVERNSRLKELEFDRRYNDLILRCLVRCWELQIFLDPL